MIYVTCNCGKRLGFELVHAGRKGRCPECKREFLIGTSPIDVEQFQAGAPPPPQRGPAMPRAVPVRQPAQIVQPQPGRMPPQPLSAPPPYVPEAEPVPGPPPRPRRRKRFRRKRERESNEDYSGFFGPEKRGISYGVVGGIVMMLIAVVWFIVGFYAGWIFYYPPILFVIGLFAFIKGLAEGNMAGER